MIQVWLFQQEIKHIHLLNGTQGPVINTKDWDVQFKWKYQSTYWVPLLLIKESNPIEVSENAMANGYSNEPSFRWWVRTFLKKSYRLVNKFKSRCLNNIFKSGVEVPLTAEYALRIDR